MLIKVMGIEMTNSDYDYVNAEIIRIYSSSWNNIKYSNKVEIIKDILLYIN